jgi:Tfp pilus assembly protein PilX
MKAKKYIFSDHGAVALPIVLILSAILLTVGLAMNMSGNNKSDIIANKDRAYIAFNIAESGIRDASEKIIRNRSYNTGYTLPFTEGGSEIAIDSSTPGQITIVSKGTFRDNTKTISAIFDIDDNGKMTKKSWTEL